MTKTTAPRVRQTNLYTIELDGKPVAQALAISQADSARLYEESQKKPLLTARLSSPLEARTLAGLPLLTRGEPVRDAATPDLFGDVPAAPVSPVVGAVVDPVLLATYCPPVGLAATPPDHGRYGCDGVYRHPPEVPPQHAPIEAVTEGLASGEEPADTTADASPESADAPTAWLDDVALTARKSDAFHAGFELGRRGLKRFSAEMLSADVEMLRGIRSGADADVVHAELLRGFDDGKAQAEPVGAQDHRRPLDDAPKGAGKVAAKYRNPDDGSTWSGRGLKPRWLVAAQETGRTMDEFLI